MTGVQTCALPISERMISMAKRAKKEIENQTKSLLDQPDEHVVKALKVANESI